MNVDVRYLASADAEPYLATTVPMAGDLSSAKLNAMRLFVPRCHSLIALQWIVFLFCEPPVAVALRDRRMRPVFNDNLLPLYRDGIGYALCHARGGGELGDEWHRAAMKATRHLSWEDLIACAQWPIANGYTRTDRLVAEGASAGGMMVGRAMTERPDLFAGVHLAFGLLNPMRAESHPNGAPNIAEFGRASSRAAPARPESASVQAPPLIP